MAEDYDVILIGAGHNGLLAGAMLGRRGVKTLILEKNPIVGGFITTEEMPGMPGFKFNPGALVPSMIRDNPGFQELNIEQRFNLEYLSPDPAFTFFFPEGKYWHLYADLQGKTAQEIERVAGPRDAEAWKTYVETYSSLMGLLGMVMFSPPTSLTDLVQLVPEGEAGLELARNLFMSSNQLLNEWFDTDYVKGAILKFMGTMGNFARDQGTGLWGTEILACAGMGRPRGGSGALSNALAAAAEAEGVAIRVNAPVDEVLVENGAAVGVRLQNGETIRSKAVISAVDPYQLFTKLVDPDKLDTRFMRRVRALTADQYSIVAAHLALSELPDFTASYPGIDNKKAVESSIIWCPSMKYNDEWQLEIAAKRLPRYPVFWAFIPSSVDPSLAPEGKHTLTVEAYCSGELKDRAWSEAKEVYADYMVEQMVQMAPNLKNAIVGRYVEGPDELEARSWSRHGNIAHLDHTLSQLFTFRPLPELSSGRAPIKNLYLSGAGAPPMGAASGAPGYVTATRFMQDWEAGLVKS